MKLITKQKDYYDYVARDRTLSDQSYIWVREPKVMKINFSIPAPVHLGKMHLAANKGTDSLDAVGFLVFFCGKVIPVAKIIERKEWVRDGVNPTSTRYVFSYDEIPEELVGSRKKSSRWTSFIWSPYADMEMLFKLSSETWMSTKFERPLAPNGHAVLPKMDINDMHRSVGAPIFCHASMMPEVLGDQANFGWESREYFGTPHVIVNPLLSAIMMNKVLDPFNAFVDIERFLTNELAPKDVKRDMSVVEKSIPDKIKAESHGFDKRSFRKDPATKPKRRKSSK